MKKDYNTNQNFDLIMNFIKRYESKYPEEAIQFLYAKLAHFDLNPGNIDGINQIYDELGILVEEDNFYKAFVEVLKEKYSFNRPIIEIGGGFFPSLGKQIAKAQLSLKNGTLTVYDPLLIPNKRPGMVLKKCTFEKSYPFTGKELLVGFFPCEATSTIIDTSLKHDLDFSIQLCGCLHDFRYSTREDYYRALKEEVEKTLPETRELQVDYLNPHYEIPFPIFSSVKKKVKK